MDEQLSGWEDRLRLDLAASVRDVRADDGLLVAAREGGRRRVRRRRALVTLPAAVVVVGGAVWASVGRQAAPQPVTPAATAPSTPPLTPPQTSAPTSVATNAPALTMDEAAARDVFANAGYTYDDAVPLGDLWNVDPYEAKALGGQALANGETLPISR